MDNTRRILLQSLANMVSDYRQNEIDPITPVHVERWLGQFDPREQPVILSEMDSIMKRFYFSKVRIKEHVRTFLKEKIVHTQDPVRLLSHVRFLDIQKRGGSQRAMLSIVDEILREEYGLTLSMTGTKEVRTYVYIDDCIYTGNRLRYDLTDGRDSLGWFSTCSASGCKLWVYTVAGHDEGIDYVRTHVQHIADEKGIKLGRITDLIINNTRTQDSNIEVLWPENLYTPYVNSYISDLDKSPFLKRGSEDLFRSMMYPEQEKLFSSLEARRVVEQAFLKKGIQFIKFCRNPASSMRPLGYMKLISLGFGTFFVTYRNIANNCPLVLWWGDPQYSPGHPFSQWYPLLPRRTNNMVE